MSDINKLLIEQVQSETFAFYISLYLILMKNKKENQISIHNFVENDKNSEFIKLFVFK